MGFYYIKHRLKIAAALTVIILSILVTNMWEKQNLNAVDHCFSSMLEDRLVPATAIFQISDHLYQKRLNVETALHPGKNTHNEKMSRTALNSKIDSIFTQYEKTYLVKMESVYLKDVLAKWKNYKILEQKVIAMAAAGHTNKAAMLYEQKGIPVFKDIMVDLRYLSNIQSEVGKELLISSQANMASINLLALLEQGLAIVIALVIVIAIFQSRITQQPYQKFHLN